MEAPAPVVLPAAVDPLDESGQGTQRHRRLLVFLTSLGDLTMYDHVGTRRWQRRTQATWANAAEDPILDRVAPTLQPLAMRRHGMPTAVLAAGAAPPHAPTPASSKNRLCDHRMHDVHAYTMSSAPLSPGRLRVPQGSRDLSDSAWGMSMDAFTMHDHASKSNWPASRLAVA